ncbi:MAG: transporter substrate-binding domain-containing protein [Mastigocoleus sp.]|mgnify:CR=1 FL=1
MFIESWIRYRRLVIFLFAFTFCWCGFPYGVSNFQGYSLFLNVSNRAYAAQFKDIQQRKYVKIAVKDNLPPLGFKDKAGNLQGLEIDLAKRLTNDLLGKPDAFRLQSVNNKQRLNVVLDGKVDLTIARVTANQSRSRLVSFSVPYYLDGTFIIIKNISPQNINSQKSSELKLTDLQNRKIAVLKNSSTIGSIKYYLPTAKLVGVSSYQEAKAFLDKGNVDAFAADGSVLSNWAKENTQYYIVPIKLSTEPLSIVMPKGLQYDELRRKVNSAILNYLETGWLQERISYWGLPPSKYSDLIESKSYNKNLE